MVNFFICGDIVNKFSDEQFIDNQLIDIIKNADYSICNLEGVLLSDNFDSMTGVFQKKSTIKNLKNAGFDMLLLANNHITDKGQEGIKLVINEAERHSLDYIGSGFSFDEIYKAKIININNNKFGLINICEAQVGHFIDNDQSYGYAWLNHPYIDKLIETTKKNVDYLLLFVHAGLEHYDIPLIEFRKLYKRYCDLGVNCVIGTHPHIAQGVEKYNNNLIFYSLGNFYFPRIKNASDKDIENHSFSIKLAFHKNVIEYTIIYHFVSDLKVYLSTSNESLVNIEYLNNKLLEPCYSRLIEHVYNKAYDELCYKLYTESLMGTNLNDSFTSALKFIIKYVFFRQKYWKKTLKYRNQLLLRLIQNETYQFLAQHVLIDRIK